MRSSLTGGSGGCPRSPAASVWVLDNRRVCVCADLQEAVLNLWLFGSVCVYRLIQHSRQSPKNPSRLKTGSRRPAAAADPHEGCDFSV